MFHVSLPSSLSAVDKEEGAKKAEGQQVEGIFGFGKKDKEKDSVRMSSVSQ